MNPESPAASGFEVMLIGVGKYAHHDPIAGLDGELRRIAEMLERLGGAGDEPWLAPGEASYTLVNALWQKWAAPIPPRSSMLVWIGHGESDGDDAWLGIYETGRPMRGSGLTPHTIAEHVINEWQRRASHDDAWAMVVVEACGADTFMKRLAANLLGRHGSPKRLALLGSGGEGSGYVGKFGDALEATLASYTDNDDYMSLKDLVNRLEDRLEQGCVYLLSAPRAARLVRRPLITSPISASLDLYQEFRAFLLSLTPDERSHFVPKAQGGELGELAWYFVGRTEETRQIIDWLRAGSPGLLVVTGPPGAGKSALLGNILVESKPDARDLLARYGHHALSGNAPPAPFDAVLSLTGLRVEDVVTRLARAAGIPLNGGAQQVDQMVDGLRSRRAPFRVLADALDEAQEPAAIAGAVWNRLAGIPGCQVVLGTRAQTRTDPDGQGELGDDLLAVLAGPDTTVLPLAQDSEALVTYVRRRLDAARATGPLIADDAAIDHVCQLLRDRHFLYARLAIHELIAKPQWLAPHRRAQLTELLSRDHRALFAAAVDRLSGPLPLAEPLLEALAHARGRGLPRADRIWASVADSLAGDREISDIAIEEVIVAAAPYVMLDGENGQTVYRLAHRTFRDFFRS